MDKGVSDLINESRDKRAKRTGERTPQSDYKPIQQQRGVGGTIARFLFGRSSPAQPGQTQANSNQPEQQSEPETQAEQGSGIDFSQGSILRGKEVHDSAKFKSALSSQLRQTSLSASQRKELGSALASKRSGGLSRTEAKKVLRDMRKSGAIKSDSQVRSVKRKLGL